MGETNYGFTLNRGNGESPTETFTAIGAVQNINPPGLLQVFAEDTHHGTGGKRTFIGTGLGEVGEFTASINYGLDDTTHDTLIADADDGNVRTWQVVYPDGTTIWEFEAGVARFQPQGADATAPGVLRAEVTFRPSGDVEISGSGST